MQNILEKSIFYLIILLFAITFFYLTMNILHSNEINENYFVSTNSGKYQEYQNNITLIEENINNFRGNNNYDKNVIEKLNKNLKRCLFSLKNSNGLYNHSGEIKSADLYNINSFFENNIIDECWNAGMNFLNDNNNQSNDLYSQYSIYQDYIKTISNDTNYIKNKLLDNSNFHYKLLSKDINVSLNSEYEMVQNNYLDFSKIILKMSSFLVGENYE